MPRDLLWVVPRLDRGDSKWSSVEVRRGSCGGCQRAGVVGGEAVEEIVKVLGGVGPVVRSGGEVVALLEGRQAVVDLGQVVEVVGGDDLALHHGEVDFALVQPARVDGGVDQGGGGPCLGHAVDGCLAAV